MGRLQVDVGETPVGDVFRKMREWLHFQSADKRTDTDDVRYTNENKHIQELQQWRLGPLLYIIQLPELQRCSWSGAEKLEFHG